MARFRVLGPVEVSTCEGVPIELPQARQRELLTVLLLYANRPLSAGRLISALWGNKQPRSAAVTLRSHLSSLRRSLLAIPRLETHTRGYLFRTSPGELDVEEFENAVARGRELFQRGAYAKAVPLLSDALNLWRDPPLSDLPRTTDMHTVADRLTDERRSVQETWVDARLALGDHAGLAGLLSAQLATDQLNEHMWAQLMVALYQSGRRTEALNAYDHVRGLLAAEFGLSPGQELRELHTRIVNGDSMARRPSSLTCTATNGPRTDEKPSEGPAAAPTETTADRPPHRLALLGGSPRLFGAERELAKLAEALTSRNDGAPPVALVEGPPGAGKTALAVHAAHTLRQHFTDGALFLPMARSAAEPPDPRHVLHEALSALGEPAAGTHQHGTMPSLGACVRALRHVLATRRVLVVMDDTGPADWTGDLVSGIADAAVIITGRKLPAVAGATRLTLGELPDADAGQLLARLTGGPATDTTLAVLRQLVPAGGRTPLGVRLAAGLLTSAPAPAVRETARWMRQEHARAERGGVRGPALRTSLAAVWRVLDARARRAVPLLALAGPHDISAWMLAALAGDDSDPAGDERGLAVLDQLTAAGLLTTVDHARPGDRRFRLPTAVLQQLRHLQAPLPDQERHTARWRLLTGWLQLAGVAGRTLGSPPLSPVPDWEPPPAVLSGKTALRAVGDPVSWCHAEQPGLLWATQRLGAAGEHAAAVRLVSCHAGFHYFYDRTSDAVRLWSSVIEAAARDGAADIAAGARLRLAELISDHYPTNAVLALVNTSMRFFEQAGDRSSMAWGRSLLSLCAERESRFDGMRAHARQGLSLSRAAGDQLAELRNLRNLGLAESSLGNHHLGKLYCGQSLVLARELREPLYEAQALQALTRLPS